MISLLIASALGNSVGVANPTPVPSPLPTPAQVKSAVEACGIPSGRVTVRFERFMQEDVVRISKGGGGAAASQLECIAKASLATTYYVSFKAEAVQARYASIYWDLAERADLTSARAALRGQNRLATVPVPQPGKPLGVYARAVETYCGVTPGTLLTALDDNTLTFKKDGLGRITANGIEPGAASDLQFQCIMNATTAAELKSHGIFFGFIGKGGRAPVPD